MKILIALLISTVLSAGFCTEDNNFKSSESIKTGYVFINPKDWKGYENMPIFSSVPTYQVRYRAQIVQATGFLAGVAAAYYSRPIIFSAGYNTSLFMLNRARPAFFATGSLASLYSSMVVVPSAINVGLNCTESSLLRTALTSGISGVAAIVTDKVLDGFQGGVNLAVQAYYSDAVAIAKKTFSNQTSSAFSFANSFGRNIFARNMPTRLVW